MIPLVDVVLDLLFRSFPVSSLSSPRWELLAYFSAFGGLDIEMRTEQRDGGAGGGMKWEEKNKQQVRVIFPCSARQAKQTL